MLVRENVDVYTAERPNERPNVGLTQSDTEDEKKDEEPRIL